MWKHITRRVLSAIITITLLTVLVFSLLYLSPGDPAERILQARMNGELPSSQDTIEVLKKDMGLDAPTHMLYLGWIKGVLLGDLGYSYVTLRPASVIVYESLQATAELVFVSILAIILLGLPLGMLAAWKDHSIIDNLLCCFAILGVSIPSYVIAFVCILIFAVTLQILPVAGRSGIESMLMPAATLSIGGVAMLMRITRYDLIEEASQDYVIAAKAKGLNQGSIFIKHIFRNSLPPLITYIGLELGGLFSGAIIIENIFAWPGIGRLLVDSVQSGDIPLVQTCVLLIGVVFVCINFFVDILYAQVDPRIKLEGVL